MTPSALPLLVLVFAAYRLTRLAGWDDFPLVARWRARLVGEEWVAGEEPSLPGKTPSSEAVEVRPAYRRPTLAHLVHCPFCVGWWISLATYGAWLAFPRPTLYAATPLAISGAVGLIAKNLDP